MYSIGYYYQSFKTGIKNLISYFSVIWNDRDWDPCYFYELLQFKLKRIRNRQNLNLYEGSEHFVKELDKAIEALDRLLEDDYCHKEWNELTEKYGNLVFKDNGITRDKDLTPEEEKDEKDAISKVSNLQYELRTSDIKLVCDIIEKNVESWWD